MDEKTNNFKCKLDSVYPEEFEVLGKYKNNRTKVMIRHNICGSELMVHPYDFLNKRQSKCKICFQTDRMKSNIDNYLIEKDLINSYSYDIGDALYQYEKIKVHCKNCKNTFEKVVDLFLLGQHCPYCANQRTNRNSAQMKIDKLTGENEYIILNDNINSHDSKAEILHVKCNRVTNTTLSYFIIQNPMCSHCAKENLRKKKMKTHEEFAKEVKEIYGKQYEILSEYSGAVIKVKLKHSSCGNIIESKPNHILSYNFGCKFCNMSMPESIIYNLLRECNINFKFQHKFNGCVGEKQLLPFDFAVYKDNKIEFLLEYDGQHHFSEKSFGKESHERTVKNDNIKNEYCKNNDIKLIRVSYKELKNLRSITVGILKSFNLL